MSVPLLLVPAIAALLCVLSVIPMLLISADNPRAIVWIDRSLRMLLIALGCLGVFLVLLVVGLLFSYGR